MTLDSGSRLRQYEVIEPIGAGGQGEVYRARDTDLGREVAIKVLPEPVARDPERMNRFHREAKLLAQLNHPGIATLYGFEEAEGVHFLVMELVEGETLADRMAAGPIGWREAIPIFGQIAEALEVAHEKGILHRDLKPSNIKVTPQGSVKILDFGLGKTFHEDGGEDSRSPTLTRQVTESGVILGTVSYMSPEQARGLPVDRRTDIWAFGCVLFEALTGKQAFSGDTATDILTQVVAREPDWSALPAELPAPLARLLERALRKDPKNRLRDMGDARLELSTELAEEEAAGRPTPMLVSRTKAWPLVFIALVAAGVVGVGIGRLGRESSPAPVARLEIGLPAEHVPLFLGRAIAFSPDGRHIAYATLGQLYVRPIEGTDAIPIPGTEGGREPFFSPDGEWIGFWHRDELKKVPVDGGPPTTLCTAESPYGASWGSDGRIIFGQGPSGIFAVSADGGERQLLTEPDPEKGEVAFHGPQLLPGGDWMLFTLLPTGKNWNDAQIVAHRLDSGERRLLVEDGTDARYIPSGPTGHLAFARGTTLMAVSFDPRRVEVRGAAVPVVEAVFRAELWESGASDFAFSESGTLAYLPNAPVPKRTLVWVDRHGVEEPLPMPELNYFHPRLSPEGDRIVVDTADTLDLWLYELDRGTMTRLTAEQTHLHPIWSADGSRVIFDSTHATGLYRKAIDEAGPAELLVTDSPRLLTAVSVSPDGRALAFERSAHHVSYDVAILSLDGSRTIRPFLTTEFREMAPMFSPNGGWLAYVSDETGQNEVYVRPYPGPGRKHLVSTDGGTEPIWSPDGTELFYRSGPSGRAMMSVTEGRLGNALFRPRLPTEFPRVLRSSP